MSDQPNPGSPPNRRAVESIHRLTELQEALLVHRLQAVDEDSGLLVLRARLVGELKAEALADAWQETVERHPVLRSSVHWRDLRHPVQVVARQVDLPIAQHDWRSLAVEERERRLAELLESERREGLDLSRAPVMRCCLVRWTDDETWWIWLCHHLLLDGWSSALVLRELLDRYAALRQNEPWNRPASRPFQEWTNYQRQNAGGKSADLPARSYRAADWLVGEPLCAPRGGTHKALASRSRTIQLDHSTIESWARAQQLTSASLLLGCWGLTLAEATGSSKAVFGVTVSGREVAFDGLEQMVGMFTNTLPLALSWTADAELGDWFRQVFERRQQLLSLQHVPLDRLFREGGVSLRRPPFDNLLAIANYPLEDLSTSETEIAEKRLRLAEFQGDLTSAFPLSIAVEPRRRLHLVAHYDRCRLADEDAERLLQRFAGLIETVVDGEPGTLGELLARAPAGLAGWQRGELYAPVEAEREQRGETSGPEAAQSEGQRPASTPQANEPFGEAGNRQIEAHLARIWNDLIGVQEVAPQDHFFLLGGHSLLVPQLLDRIAQDFSVELPLGMVFQAPTLAGLAATIEAADGQAGWQQLVPIRPHGPASPLFLVHGLGGEVSWFYNLANYLDPAVPLFGLQAPPEPFDDLPRMAASYVKEVRRQQPEGPYRLGGYCVGGGVAFEMARQLVGAGQRVEMLILIDSVPHATVTGEGTHLGQRWVRRARSLLAKPPQQIATSTADFVRQTVRRGYQKALVGKPPGALPELDDVLDMRTVPRVYHQASRCHYRAMRDYRPGIYPGDMWLFRTQDPRWGEDFGWGPLVDGRLRIERVVGGHVEVLEEPHVREVGRKLSGVLEGVAQAGRSGRFGGPTA